MRSSPLCHLLLTIAVTAAFCSATADSADLKKLLDDPNRPAADQARDASDHPARVIALAGVEPGMRLLDLFSGPGYYAELLGAAVAPGGEVLLHNNQAFRSFVGDALEQRLATAPANVTVYDAEADTLNLEPASLDGVFLVMAFHDFFYRTDGWAVTAGQVLPQLHRALKPGGFVLVVDHRAEPGSGTSAAQDLHRIDEPAVTSTMAEFGFELALADAELLRSPRDDFSVSVFDPAVRGNTERFVHRYVKVDTRR